MYEYLHSNYLAFTNKKPEKTPQKKRIKERKKEDVIFFFLVGPDSPAVCRVRRFIIDVVKHEYHRERLSVMWILTKVSSIYYKKPA